MSHEHEPTTTEHVPTEFDQKILKALPFVSGVVFTEVSASYLLAAIVECAIAERFSDRLDPLYSAPAEARKLIKEKTELLGALQSAWEVEAFGSILHLGDFICHLRSSLAS